MDPQADYQRDVDLVIVPDVVGMRFLAARDAASAAGLSLANPDPDGPPISTVAWPRNPTIKRQDPLPGSVAHQWDSLRVWLRSDLEPDMARRHQAPPPPFDQAHAVPDNPPVDLDLAGEVGDLSGDNEIRRDGQQGIPDR